MRLWACPNGRHPAVRGPERPRKNATCRFCLPCSQGSAALVERVAPALVRERAVAKASQVMRAQDLRERTRQNTELARAAYPVGWLREWHAVAGKLAAWPRPLGPREVEANIRAARPQRYQVKGAIWGRDVVDTTGRLWPAETHIGEGVDGPVYYDEPAKARTSGHAYGTRRIALTAGTDRADALATLLHELAHCACPRESHGDGWRSTFVAAVEELTGRSLAEVELDGHRRSGIELHDQLRCLIALAGLHEVGDPRRWHPGC